MREAVLVIVCGRAYAGKTTFSRALATSLGIPCTSFDDLLEEEDLDPRTMTQRDWDRAYSLTYDRVQSALVVGSSAILDGANTRTTRDTARAIAREAGAATRLFFLSADEEEVWRRWRANAETQQRAQLADETMELALALFEVPGDDEHATVLSAEMPPEACVAAALAVR
jgi:predicted kinase